MPRGGIRTKAHAAAVSRTKREQFLKKIEDEPGHIPPTKVCSRCGVEKKIKHFILRKRMLASGVERLYPTSECRLCQSKRTQRWRDENKDRKQKESGVRYKKGDKRRERLPAEPLARFLDERVKQHGSSAVALAAQMDEARIRRLASCQDERGQRLEFVTLDMVDRLLLNLGCQDCLIPMYGDQDLVRERTNRRRHEYR